MVIVYRDKPPGIDAKKKFNVTHSIRIGLFFIVGAALLQLGTKVNMKSSIVANDRMTIAVNSSVVFGVSYLHIILEQINLALAYSHLTPK